jgi:hypothetical protein
MKPNIIKKIKSKYMATKTKKVEKAKPVVNQPIPADEVIDKVIELFTIHQETADAIMEDYFMQSGAVLELEASYKNFIDAVYDIEIKPEEKEEEDEDADEKAFERYSKEYSMYSVTLTTEDQVEKLRTFLETEIYPYHSDQSNIHF